MKTSCQDIVTSKSFFQFMTNLEQPENRIMDGHSLKLMFSLKKTVYLTKTENRTKKSQKMFSRYCFE